MKPPAEPPFISGVILAAGSGPDLAYHQARTPSKLVLAPYRDGGACLCAEPPAPFGSAAGSLLYVPNATQAGERGARSSVSTRVELNRGPPRRALRKHRA